MLEILAVIVIISVFLSMLIPNYIYRINQAKYEKTINELTSIAQASIDYFNLNGSWPDSSSWVSQLIPKYLPNGGVNRLVLKSPFGTFYQAPMGINNMVTASVLIPTGIAQKNPEGPLLILNIKNQGNQDLVEITQTIDNQFTARLSYNPINKN